MERDAFVDVLVDLHIFDAISTDYSLSKQFDEIDSTILYTSVLHKHNTTREQFDNTLAWYSKNTKEFDDVYNDVFGILDKQNEAISEKTKLFTGNEAELIWADKHYKHISKKEESYPAPITVELKGIGEYLFDIKLRVLPQDKSDSPTLLIYFFKDEADENPEDRLIFKRAALIKSNYTRDYQYFYTLEDESYKYAKIIIPETPDRDAGKAKNLQLSRVRVMKVKEKAVEADKEE